MARFMFAFFVLVHGLIHLMGFVKAFRPAQLVQFKYPISKPTGVLWLVAFLLFVLTAILLFSKKQSWWIMAVPAVVLSQMLIVMNWRDAKFGTIANVIILIATIVGYGTWNFGSMVQQELETLIIGSGIQHALVSEDVIAPLPDPVQKWLKHTNVIGKEFIRTVHLHQTGEMRTSANGKWMPYQAEQFVTIDKPGFIWVADVKMAPLVQLAGRDKYENGKGHMLIKLFSLVPIVDAKGPEIDQGSLVRFLAETVWFPAASLMNYIRWKEVDSSTAEATMSYGGTTASETFRFSSDGDIKSIDTTRYYNRKEGTTLEKWHIDADPQGFKDFEGVRIPTKLSVTWKLKGGDFTWLKLEITDMEYNKMHDGQKNSFQ